jgi:hypothetical protein
MTEHKYIIALAKTLSAPELNSTDPLPQLKEYLLSSNKDVSAAAYQGLFQYGILSPDPSVAKEAFNVIVQDGYFDAQTVPSPRFAVDLSVHADKIPFSLFDTIWQKDNQLVPTPDGFKELALLTAAQFYNIHKKDMYEEDKDSLMLTSKTFYRKLAFNQSELVEDDNFLEASRILGVHRVILDQPNPDILPHIIPTYLFNRDGKCGAFVAKLSSEMMNDLRKKYPIQTQKHTAEFLSEVALQESQDTKLMTYAAVESYAYMHELSEDNQDTSPALVLLLKLNDVDSNTASGVIRKDFHDIKTWEMLRKQTMLTQKYCDSPAQPDTTHSILQLSVFYQKPDVLREFYLNSRLGNAITTKLLKEFNINEEEIAALTPLEKANAVMHAAVKRRILTKR